MLHTGFLLFVSQLKAVAATKPTSVHIGVELAAAEDGTEDSEDATADDDDDDDEVRQATKSGAVGTH